MEQVISKLEILNGVSEVFSISEFHSYFFHLIRKKCAVGEFYKRPILDSGNYAKTHQTFYFISDTRKQAIIEHADRKWLEEGLFHWQ